MLNIKPLCMKYMMLYVDYHQLNLQSSNPHAYFNAHIRTDTKTWNGVIGSYRVPGLNENRRCQLQLCYSNGLRNLHHDTFYQHRYIFGIDQVWNKNP